MVDERYPQLAGWVRHEGWGELGQDDFSTAFIRVLDSGGMVWEGAASYPTLESALAAADEAVGVWLLQQGMPLSQ